MAAGTTGSGPRESPVGGLLIDLDGVVYVGEEPLPGAVECIRNLRARGLPFRFVTNTSTKPAHDVEAKLARLGIEARPGEVMTPVRAAVSTLRRMGAKAPYLVVDERVAPEFGSLTPAGVFPDPPTERPDFIVVGDIGVVVIIGGDFRFEFLDVEFVGIRLGLLRLVVFGFEVVRNDVFSLCIVIFRRCHRGGA